MADELDTQYQVRLPSSLLEAARTKAAKSDITLSLVLRWYLRAWVEGKAPLFPPNNPSDGEGQLTGD